MPQPTVQARLSALSGDLGVLTSTAADGTPVHVVVRVAGYHWHSMTAAGDGAAWKVVQNELPWRILEAGGPDRLPLAEPWVDGVPLGVAMRARGWVSGGTLGYPLTLQTDPAPVGTLQQLSSWVDTLVVITVAIGALVVISLRDQRILADEQARQIRVPWWKRPGRWLLGPGFGKPIPVAPPPPPPESKP